MNVVTPCQMYWLTRCDGICDLAHTMFMLFLILFTVTALFATVGTVVSFSEPDDEQVYKTANLLRMATFALALCAVFFGAVKAFVPTTREMAAILVVPRVANSKTVEDLGRDVVNLARDWMQELRPERPPMSVPAEKGTATPK